MSLQRLMQQSSNGNLVDFCAAPEYSSYSTLTDNQMDDNRRIQMLADTVATLPRGRKQVRLLFCTFKNVHFEGNVISLSDYILKKYIVRALKWVTEYGWERVKNFNSMSQYPFFQGHLLKISLFHVNFCSDKTHQTTGCFYKY